MRISETSLVAPHGQALLHGGDARGSLRWMRMPFLEFSGQPDLHLALAAVEVEDQRDLARRPAWTGAAARGRRARVAQMDADAL
ncbi:hypothetical protein CTI14_67090, partial [Methylobacterium radiotolerans]